MEILVVGNYCHDTTVHADGTSEVLGGSAAYIARALAAAGVSFEVVAKVGADFLYHDAVLAQPRVSRTHPTAHFVDRREHGRTVSILRAAGEPIYPADLPAGRAAIGIACGVAGEIRPGTLAALRERVDLVICDIQALIRRIDPGGVVDLENFSRTGFREQLPLIDLLKASKSEFPFLDVEVPRSTKLLVTAGPTGTLVRDGAREVQVAPFPAREIDATGAGDSFVAGLAIGLLRRQPLLEAVRLGNRYGAFAVEAVGIPDFSELSRAARQ